MKKKIVLALCLLASLSGYAQWWSGHAENVVFDEDARTMTITGLQAGHLGDIITEDYVNSAGDHINLRVVEAYHEGWVPNLYDGELIWDDHIDDPYIEEVTISGKLNGSDIKILADLCKAQWVDWVDNENFSRMYYSMVRFIDISECQIVAGGGYYIDETFDGNQYIVARPTDQFIENGTYQLTTSDNEIGDLMFFGCDALQEIILPKTITKIGAHAFEALVSMTEIKIPPTVTEIGEEAFLWSMNMEVAPWNPVTERWEVQPLKVTFLNEEEPMTLGDDALKLGEAFGQEVIADLTTPVGLLDDYALNSVLKDNFEAGSVKATATPPNKYWTFSSGVDVIIPDNVKVYTCQIVNGETDIRELTDELVIDEKRTIKRNNGVLVACPDDATSNAYELVAKYNADLVGTTPATTNANDYPNNSLVPVIKKAHYEPGEYYMLYHGKWVVLAGDDAKVPAGKALLKK